MNRGLDGIYFRVQREGKWDNICFSDMTEQEIEKVIGNRKAAWWKSVAMHLKEQLNQIGEEFDIIGEDCNECC